MNEILNEISFEPFANCSVDEVSIAWIDLVLPDLLFQLIGRTHITDHFAKLPIAQFRLVKALPNDEIGETMGRLSDELHIKASALTQVADRAIQQKLVERVSDPDDRRVVRLRLTDEGRQWNEDRLARRRARLNRIWQGITPEERIEFLSAVHTLDRLSRRADELTATQENPSGDAIDLTS